MAHDVKLTSKQRLQAEVAADAIKSAQDRDDDKVDAIVSRKGILPKVKEQIAMAKKERMRTVKHYLCDKCDAVIMDEEDGFVVHGNIYTANPEKRGGLIGDNFPPLKEGEQIDPQAIQKTALCKICFLKVLGFDRKPQTRNTSKTEGKQQMRLGEKLPKILVGQR